MDAEEIAKSMPAPAAMKKGAPPELPADPNMPLPEDRGAEVAPELVAAARDIQGMMAGGDPKDLAAALKDFFHICQGESY